MDISKVFWWGNRYFRSQEALKRSVKGLQKAIAMSKEFKDVKGWAYVKDKKGDYRVMHLRCARMSQKAGNAVILLIADTLKELKRESEKDIWI